MNPPPPRPGLMKATAPVQVPPQQSSYDATGTTNGDIAKMAAIQKVKEVANAANGGKKRRKGTDLKPIDTADKSGTEIENVAPSPTSIQDIT